MNLVKTIKWLVSSTALGIVGVVLTALIVGFLAVLGLAILAIVLAGVAVTGLGLAVIFVGVPGNVLERIKEKAM